MRKSMLALLAASSLLLPVLADAEAPGYSFVDAGYVVTDIDNYSEDADGFLLRGSIEFAADWFLYARYLDQSLEVFGTDLDLSQYAVGAGYAWPLNDTTDLYGKAGYTEVEVDAPGATADDDGFELIVGLRSRAFEQLELEGAVNYIDLSDSGDDTSVGVAARWYFAEQFAVGVEGEFGDDASSYGIGVRWDFGQ